MLKALIKKQFMEIFRGFFVNRKNGKAYTKGRVTANITLFTVLMLVIAGSLAGLSSFFAITFIPINLGWLYFSILGMVSVILGIIGSVFNTYAGLYRAKDNDLLISMPIPPVKIVISRVAGVYGTALLYSGLLWVPALVVYHIVAGPSAASIIFSILLFFFIGALVTVLTCILGWVVAIAAGKLKGRNIVTVLIAVALFLVYYFFCFRMSSIMQHIADNAQAVGRSFKDWGNVFYWLGLGAAGNAGYFLLFAAVTAVLSLLCLAVLSKTFLKLTAMNSSVSAGTGKKTELVQNDVKKTLFRKELARFTSSTTYMLNCGLGLFLLPILAILICVKRNDVMTVIWTMLRGIPWAAAVYAPMLAILAVFLVSGLNLISTPSVSLEGKSLWLLKSLPVKPYDILTAKCRLHEVFNYGPALFSGVLICISLKAAWTETVLVLAAIFLHVMFIARLGLVFGLKRPNFTWTNEIVPIKQSLNMLFVMLINLVVTIAVAGCCLLLQGRVSTDVYLVFVVVILALIVRMMNEWLKKKGSRLFEEL